MMFPAACIFERESAGKKDRFFAGIEAWTNPPEMQCIVADVLELDHRGCLVISRCLREPLPCEVVRTGEPISGEK